jgi:hypothetical protein
VLEVLAVMRQAGIALRPSLVSFTPWTTMDDYLDVLGVVEAEELIDHVDPVQYTIRLLVPPGSLLVDSAAIQPFLGPLDQAAFTYHWTHPDPRMDALHQAVTALVEEATRADEDPALTFYRVRELACAAHDDRPVAMVAEALPADRSRPPRLTEPWFC